MTLTLVHAHGRGLGLAPEKMEADHTITPHAHFWPVRVVLGGLTETLAWGSGVEEAAGTPGGLRRDRTKPET